MIISRSMLTVLACSGALAACSTEPAKAPMEPARPEAPAASPSAVKNERPARPAEVAPPSPVASRTAAFPSQSIYFDFDESLLKKEYQDAVLKHSRYLTANPAEKVVLEGNADERGSREYNLALGNERAEAVKRALVLLGVPEA